MDVHVCTYSCVKLWVYCGKYVEVRGQPQVVHTLFEVRSVLFAAVCLLQASWFVSFWRILLSLNVFSRQRRDCRHMPQFTWILRL